MVNAELGSGVDDQLLENSNRELMIFSKFGDFFFTILRTNLKKQL